ncbi:hypothetical protein [Microcoleus sp. Pol12B5]|uniref:hypothetical protein n=1 Tax=Microcoleus sp. Pol12B5 TaxID=3055396 RepID=UPI002FCFE9B9
MPVVKFSEADATVEGGTWTSDDNDLTDLLNEWTQNEIRTATIGEPFFLLYSPSNPYPDMTIAQAAAEAWDGEITDEGTPLKHDPDRIY